MYKENGVELQGHVEGLFEVFNDHAQQKLERQLCSKLQHCFHSLTPSPTWCEIVGQSLNLPEHQSPNFRQELALPGSQGCGEKQRKASCVLAVGNES